MLPITVENLGIRFNRGEFFDNPQILHSLERFGGGIFKGATPHWQGNEEIYFTVRNGSRFHIPKETILNGLGSGNLAPVVLYRLGIMLTTEDLEWIQKRYFKRQRETFANALRDLGVLPDDHSERSSLDDAGITQDPISDINTPVGGVESVEDPAPTSGVFRVPGSRKTEVSKIPTDRGFARPGTRATRAPQQMRPGAPPSPSQTAQFTGQATKRVLNHPLRDPKDTIKK